MLFSCRHFLATVFLLLVTFAILSRSHPSPSKEEKDETKEEKKEEKKEKKKQKSCEEEKRDQKYKPNVPHLVLNNTYLNNFNEIIVIGDVHGCLDEFKLLLKNAHIDDPRVLKILTGDLVRKGPKSKQVVEFIRKTPDIISVRGNNDENAMTMRHRPSHALKTYDQFIPDMSDADWKFLEQLPYSISIPKLNILVVHAGLLPDVPLQDTEPFTIMNVRNLSEDDECIGGYNPKKNLKKAGHAWGSVWNGPEHIVFGHDRKRALQLHEKTTGVDTACVYGKELSGVFIMGPRTGTVAQQPCPTNYKKKFQKEDHHR